jgi:hypothetical protein
MFAFLDGLKYLKLTLLSCSLAINDNIFNILIVGIDLLIELPFVTDQLSSIVNVQHVEHESLSMVHHVMKEKTLDLLECLVTHETIDRVGH